MAELAALSLERLLALARSLLACFRDGQPTNDNIHWPPVPELQAMLLQSQVRDMQRSCVETRVVVLSMHRRWSWTC